MMKHILIALLFAITQTSYSQYFVESKVNSLSIEENDSLTFMGDTLVIDSLIMADNSALLFNKNAFVIVKNSFIGNSTVISSAGSDGKDGANSFFTFSHAADGEDGLPGKDLTLFINFNELGSLNITSQGGNGGNGGNGYYEGKSGNGGIGGAGGKLAVYYTYDGITPKFNRLIPEAHAVHINSDSGICGDTGKARANYKRKAWNPQTSNYNTAGIGRLNPKRRDNNRLRGYYSITSNRYKYGRDQPQSNECYSGDDGEITLKKVIYD